MNLEVIHDAKIKRLVDEVDYPRNMLRREGASYFPSYKSDPEPLYNKMEEGVLDIRRPDRFEFKENDNESRAWGPGKAELRRVNFGDRNFRAITVTHGSVEAAKLIAGEVSGQINDPKSWLFMIEGIESGYIEANVAKLVASKDERKIPVVDPIISPSSPCVVSMYAKELGVEFDTVLGDLVTSVGSFFRVKSDRAVAAMIGFTEAEVKAARKKTVVGSVRRSLRGDNDALKIDEGLGHVSNIVSAQVMDYQLRRNAVRRDVAMCIGRAHEEILNIDRSTIPLSMRLDDAQIEQILRERDERNTRTNELRKRGELPDDDEDEHKQTFIGDKILISNYLSS